MASYFKPRFKRIFKTVSAVLLMFIFASPAFGGPADARWDPPARYMGPYHGQLTVHRLHPAAVEGACAQLLGEPYTPGRARRGCAYVWYKPDRCTIIIIDRPAYGTTPEAVFTHEKGHCNGWASDHPTEENIVSKVKRFLAASLLACILATGISRPTQEACV